MDIITKEEFMANKHIYFHKIKKGAIFIYPTDTVYGIGCNAQDQEAVERLRVIKQTDQPFSVIAPGKDWIMKNCDHGHKAVSWLKKLPGPYTLIMNKKKHDSVAKKVTERDTIGIRIPDHWFSEAVEDLGIPIITSSANISGHNIISDPEDIEPELSMHVDFMIDAGDIKGHPSALVHLDNEQEKIIERK